MTINTQKLRDLVTFDFELPVSVRDAVDDACDHIDAQAAEIARLREALDGAATSLNTIATLAGSKDDYLEDVFQVRGYAHNRARVARAALSGESK